MTSACTSLPCGNDIWAADRASKDEPFGEPKNFRARQLAYQRLLPDAHPRQLLDARVGAYGRDNVQHINGSKIYMGDFHTVARAYARSHVVVRGDKNCLQSLDDHKRKNKKS